MSADQGELFPLDRPAARMRPAVEAQIVAWQAAGRAVSTLTRAALLTMAEAIDDARVGRRPTAVTGGMRIFVEALQVFRLVDETPPPAGDELDRLLAALGDNDRAVS